MSLRIRYIFILKSQANQSFGETKVNTTLGNLYDLTFNTDISSVNKLNKLFSIICIDYNKDNIKLLHNNNEADFILKPLSLTQIII